MNEMKRFWFLILIFIGGCTNVLEPQLTVLDKEESSCISPPPEFYAKSTSGNVEGKYKEEGIKISVGASNDVMRLREENIPLDKYKEIAFNLCHAYRSGDISKGKYQSLYEENLSNYMGVDLAKKKLDHQIQNIEFQKLQKQNKVSIELDDIYKGGWLNQAEYINAKFSVDQLSITITDISLTYKGKEIFSNRFSPFNESMNLVLNHGDKYSFPLATEQEIVDGLGFDNVKLYKVLKSGNNNILDNIDPHMITILVEYYNPIISTTGSIEFNVFAHLARI
ncbi:MAG: hypothetical protein ACI8Q1_002458 [Parvicella sp.]|jgi:hypothetical protein